MDNSTSVTSSQYQANYITMEGKILLGICVILGIVYCPMQCAIHYNICQGRKNEKHLQFIIG